MGAAEKSDPRRTGLADEADFERSVVPDDGSAPSTILEGGVTPAITGEGVPPGEQPDWIGKRLGRFKLLRLIGTGAMGFVVQALDVNLQRVVALKVLRKRIKGDQQDWVQLFLREARAAARIEHPNVVQVYEIDQVQGWWYIAMEMVEGEDLRAVVKAAGPLPPERACPLIADAATALAVAHERGIIHRDVKPSNVMITRDGRGKLTDFGLVRVSDPNDPFDFTDKSVGTPRYMAPEVMRGEPHTSKIDIYSLGATLYYALAGSSPHSGKKLADLYDQIRQGAPDVRKVCPKCSASLAALVRRAMARDPADRPTAAEFAAALRAEAISWHVGESGIVIPSAAGSTLVGLTQADGWRVVRRRRRVRRWVLALLATAALVTAAMVLWPLVRGEGEGVGGDLEALRGRFPSAPPTYGILPPGAAAPQAPPPTEAPAFSWIGKVDASGLRFVASKRGRYFWPIDAPEAVFIRAEDFVGYRTVAAARADGKVPAP